MLKTKVLIKDISNLTDARYFSAWGVDYLGFTLDKNSISTNDIIEIINWVEGPSFFIQLADKIRRDQIFEIKSKTNLNAILATQEIISHYAKDFESMDQIIAFDDYVMLQAQERKFHFVNTLEELRTIEDLEISGIVLSGGDEEKAGFKAFDMMDEIFEYLEIE